MFTSLLHSLPSPRLCTFLFTAPHNSPVCLCVYQVFKKQASVSVCALGQRLHEQEQDFAGKASSFQREIQHLQAQLRDRQEQLNGALQQKR
ncbi:centrosomal protein of 89 kDa isoform X1 [Tachysurus ichikawai]